MIARLRRARRRIRGGRAVIGPERDSEALLRVQRLEARLREVESALVSTSEGHTAWLADLQAGIGDIQGALAGAASGLGGVGTVVEGHTQQLTDLNAWMTSTVMTVTAMSSTPVLPSPSLQASGVQGARRADPVAILEHAQSVWQVMTWLALDASERDTRISVIMPTRDRREHLERAVASVLAQRHQRLELVIVDDGSTDSTQDFLASLKDPRVRHLRTTGVGHAAARNLGLDRATGDVITYLDDDNFMHPGWLHAVAWAFDRLPASRLLYGARLIEDAPARSGSPSGAMPSLEFTRFDRARLEQQNFIDLNTIAHCAGLPEARFDESLKASVDWQLALVLTARYAPLELPYIACLYGAYAPGRVADTPIRLESGRRVRARVHTTRPMRILGYNELFPLVSETYIHEEMSALGANGASIGFAAARESVSPYPIDEPVWDDLDEGIRAHDPDLIFMYWVTHAAHELPRLERHGRPFALRVHSFDFDVAAIQQLQEHPLCAGVWAYPLQAARLKDAHALAPILQSHQSIPEPHPVRDLVVSVSAGLPKKNFPLLLDAMDRFQDLERWIVVAHSNNEEATIEYLQRAVAEREVPPTLRVNLPRTEVFRLLSRTAVALYTANQDVKMGMPMSIIEAMRAGSCVVHVDREELRQVLGTSWRPYRTADDIVRQVREVIAGGVTIDAERKANVAYATENFCAAERGRRFHEEVSAAIEAWRLRVG